MRYQGFVRKARIFQFTFCGRQFIKKKDQSKIIKFIDQMNGFQVTNFHNRSTEPLNYRIYARPQSIKQARLPEFYKYTRLPVTRWVKLSLNFESLSRV